MLYKLYIVTVIEDPSSCLYRYLVKSNSLCGALSKAEKSFYEMTVSTDSTIGEITVEDLKLEIDEIIS